MSNNNVREYEPSIVGYTCGEVGMSETVEQINALKKAGCRQIVTGEDHFLSCLNELHEGDTLIACGLYALPCSLPDFVGFIKNCENKGVGFCTLKEGDFVDADLSNPDTTPQMQLFTRGLL
jgi:DNA invertase Pin-like site-specific DNA recombinase